jgi:hypothetical protein
MYWCELCRVWMNDSKAAKLNHERGAKHQENLQRSELSVGTGSPGAWTACPWQAAAHAAGACLQQEQQ